ncbi:Uncharacterised protein [Klebsiella pneumoniae]|nr:Uncharacterised protein [Klebsiella pneumoniae]
MLAINGPEGLTVFQKRYTDAGPESDHQQSLTAFSCSKVVFAENSRDGIIVDAYPDPQSRLQLIDQREKGKAFQRVPVIDDAQRGIYRTACTDPQTFQFPARGNQR